MYRKPAKEIQDLRRRQQQEEESETSVCFLLLLLLLLIFYERRVQAGSSITEDMRALRDTHATRLSRFIAVALYPICES